MGNERDYWLGFSAFPGVGPTRFTKLLDYFGNAKDAWIASEKILESVIGPTFASSLKEFQKTFSLGEYKKQLQKANVYSVFVDEISYPALLKQIKNPPFVLYYKGDVAIVNERPIGIVGTRKITEYGRHVTELLTRELVAAGCTIVSGLALGVDGAAHATTIENGGRTIAVLGCGVDCCSPREHQSLYNSILTHGGAIVSEVPLGMVPFVGSFPSRNRIIAGLSLGVVVTEGAENSGSLITAKDALENGRKVFAVPGPVTSSLSVGPYQLIKKGATIVSSAKEIIDELGIKNHELGKNRKVIKGDTKEEQKIIDLLQNENIHFDELVRRTQIDSSQLGTILSLMEMKGIIKSFEAGMYGLV